MENKYVVVRSNGAGVFVGKIHEREGNIVTLSDCRRLWYWSGAASLSQLANDGVKNSKECKFSVVTVKHTIFNVLEIIEMSEIAIKNIYEVAAWRI